MYDRYIKDDDNGNGEADEEDQVVHVKESEQEEDYSEIDEEPVQKDPFNQCKQNGFFSVAKNAGMTADKESESDYNEDQEEEVEIPDDDDSESVEQKFN